MRIREMTEADITAVAGLRVRGWRYAYAGLLPRAYLDGLSVARDAARRRKMFATAPGTVTQLVAGGTDGTVYGWAACGPYRDGSADAGDGDGAAGGLRGSDADGELYALYVEPRAIGTGIGRALLAAALGRAAGQGFRRLLLWVLEGNDRARRFYARAGFVPDGGHDVFEAGGVSVPEVRYARDLGTD